MSIQSVVNAENSVGVKKLLTLPVGRTISMSRHRLDLCKGKICRLHSTDVTKINSNISFHAQNHKKAPMLILKRKKHIL